MHIAILLAFIIPLSFTLAGQPQRYLVSSSGKTIPLQNGEDPSKAIQAYDCTQPLVLGPDYLPHADILIPLHHRQKAAQWYIAPTTGSLDTLYFVVASLSGVLQDSTVYIGFRESIISNSHGPGDGTYPTPCTPWGYYTSTADSDNGIAAFPEDATDTTWHSTVGGPTPSFAPMWIDVWGLNFPTHVTSGINKVPIVDILGLNVTKGERFFVAMRQRSPSYHPSPDSEATIVFRATSNGVPSPSRAWKFFEHTPSFEFSCGADSVPGWYDQTYYGEPMMYMWWFSMTPTGNPLPVITSISPLGSTLSTEPREVDVEITDCYPAHPESAGVDLASSVILYSVNGGPTLSSPMTIVGDGDFRGGCIPGQPVGSIVSYRVRAMDRQGNNDSTGLLSYRVVSVQSDGYRCDTGYACTSTPIHSTGTAIDTSEWFISARDYEKAPPGFPPHRGDDGTAGPYSLGGPFVFYGDTVNYAWIGVNGAIALSKTATDTIDVNLKGFATSGWDFPYRQHHSRADTNSEGGVPKNFIAPFWSDWIVKQDSPIGTFGKIRHYADSSRFITEWDSIGVFDANGAAVDIGVFRVVLHRASGIIEFQNDDIAIFGTETAPGTLIGMQCDSLTHHVAPGDFPPFNFWNSSGYPLETRLHNGLCFRYVPVYSTLAASDGWQLVSVSTSSPDMTKSFLFPNACSNAFFYDGTYQPHYSSDALRQGVGYWMKFCGPIPLIGTPAEEETVHVNVGWNMIGSIGSPLAATSIVSSPPSIITGNFFGFEGNYTVASTLEPGRGYWVNASADGTLYLTASANASSNARIRIVPTNELPPPPPSESDLTHPVSHLPHQFALGQNYPNPFNPTTVIRFEIRDPGFVLLKIFDVLGREVATIVNERLEPGEYARTWDASNIPSGVYFYRLTAGTFSQTREMTLLR